MNLLQIILVVAVALLLGAVVFLGLSLAKSRKEVEATSDARAKAEAEAKEIRDRARKEAETKAAETLHDGLKQFCVIEETDVTRSSRLNGGTSEAGRDGARAVAVKSLAIWNACPAQLSRVLPDMTQKAKDDYQALIKKPKSDPKAELLLLSKIYGNCILGANLQRQGR